jgi:serine/threonine-protein kinase HipA
LRQQGIVPEKLTVLQRLALAGTTGRGALEYHPDKSLAEESAFLDFDKLAADVEKILTNEFSEDSLETLYLYGGSSGGARPKIFVKIEDKYWLIKFKATIDPPDVGKTEYAYSLLARECGINMPDTQLFESY